MSTHRRMHCSCTSGTLPADPQPADFPSPTHMCQPRGGSPRAAAGKGTAVGQLLQIALHKKPDLHKVRTTTRCQLPPAIPSRYPWRLAAVQTTGVPWPRVSSASL